MIQNIAKYIDAENDYLVINTKKEIVENLLRESGLSVDKIAKMAKVTLDFVKNIQQKLNSEK